MTPTTSSYAVVEAVSAVAEMPEITVDEEEFRSLETHAHIHRTLISSDALRLIMSEEGGVAEHMGTLDRVIDLAQRNYPSENEWMVLNKERVMSLLA